jgi:hypothetical protein
MRRLLNHALFATFIAGCFVSQAHAAIIISEVAPWSSSNSPATLAVDWFELTNTGASAVTITGWKMDDNSNAFGSSVALTGITSIGAGESVVFLETTSLAAKAAAFNTLWFGSSPPAGLQIGSYSGSGVGLSTSPGDAVNIFDAAGTLVTRVDFGVSPTGPFATFDNAAGLTNATVSQFSVVGVNGAFAAVNDAAEIGSPGRISAVPLPAALPLLLAGLGGLGAAVRRRRSGQAS